MEKLDAVVVGAGLSGLAAAYYLALGGLQVIVLERGDFPGTKNVTGGRLYTGPLRGLVPELLDGAPLERMVTSERVTLLSQEGSVTLNLRSDSFRAPHVRSWTVLRARLDRWLGERVMEKGGFVIPQKRVDGLLREGDRVVGIWSDGEEIRSDVVILAEGALGLLCQEAGLRGPLLPQEAALGVKEVIRLPQGSLEPRFGLPPREGAAHLFVGAVTRGIFGGGFLYTNEETLSLGIVVGVQALRDHQEGLEPHELLESFKKRPEISPYIEDGETLEYSAHLVPEGGWISRIRPYGDGYVMVGDAAGMTLNTGWTVRGMDLALASGRLAADAVLEAKQEGDFSSKSLARYQRLLEESFVLKELRGFQNAPKILSNPRLYSDYPSWLHETLKELYTVGERPRDHAGRIVWRSLRKGPPLRRILGDLWSMLHL